MAATVERSSSALLSSLGEAFGDVIRKDYDRELTQESKKKEKELKQQKKAKKGKKKDDKQEEKKSRKDVEEKRLVREGRNSLITYPNASSFSVFSHIRHFVLQTQLCETYNSQLGAESEGENEREVEGEEGKGEVAKMPVVVGLGVRGVFTIIQDIWRSNPELCLRALRELLNILQGQSPAGLRNEPKETTDALFQLLMEMVTEPVPSDARLLVELSSVATACLFSLVVALGDTGKILAAVAATLTAPPELSQHTLQIPEIFYLLQTSVQAVLLGAVLETNWSQQGVPSRSLVEEWPLETGEDGRAPSLTSDGQFLYLHGPFGLLKVGSGYGNTKKGHVYKASKDFHPDDSAWLGYSSGKLYYYPLGRGEDTVVVVGTESLQEEGRLELEADALGPQCLFTDKETLGQIRAKKEGGYQLRKFTTLCSPMMVVEEKELQLSQKSVLCMGRAKYDPQETLHTLYQDSSEQVVQIMASRSFAAIQTASGKLLYTGNGAVFGITGKDVPKGEWKMVELPDKNVKVEHCSCDNAGTFSLIVTDKGNIYFGGLNKKGEAAEAVGGRQQPKPMKLKRILKLKDHEVVSSACGAHATAMVSKDGKLFMFGSLEEDMTDKTSGVVTGLLGVPASQVAMGRSHTCVLTQHGTIFTFGNNTYGQCGRNFVPPKGEVKAVEEVEEEESSSEEEGGGDMCPSGDHKWAHNVCMMCKFCGYCTGYGPGCCNEGLPGRDAGMECGCGSGDSGCSDCGCCRVCAGEKDHWGGGFGFEEMQFGDAFERIRRIRDRLRSRREKRKEKEKEKKEKEDKGEMGLQLLFGGEPSEKASEGAGPEEKEDGEAEGEEEEGSTKKPAVVPIPDDMTAMQIDCGTFHTAVLLHSGEVHVFGYNNHGQLGQGNNKVCGHPVKVQLPGVVTQLACGDNHTVVLLESGEVFTFGKHQEGQLGRSREEGDNDDWHMIPRPVPALGEASKATWVGARGNQTFIAVDESLISESALSQCRVFANSQTIGLVPPARAGAPKPNIIMIDRGEQRARKFDGEDQQNLADCGLCIDPEYNILWSFSQATRKIACFNPIAANIKDPTGTILSSSICLPRSKEAVTSRSHTALNLLSCLHTLATLPALTLETLAGSKLRRYDKEEYNCVIRFNAHGGGWGYSSSSVEAIRFSPDADILLGGFGLYGGRGTYNGEIKVFDIGESGGDHEVEGSQMASHTETGYSCERQQTFRVLFEKPVLLTADHWYVAYAAVSSPSGASSDAGSSGQSEMQGTDKVVFKIKSSKRSNNGTDVASGQIPEILYKIPEIEKDDGVKIQLLERDFSSTVSPDGLNAVLRLLDWAWSRLTQPAPPDPSALTHDPQQLAFVAKAALGLLKTYIREAYPEKGRIRKPSLDCPELAEAVFEARSLLRLILSTRGPLPPVDGSHVSLVLDACCDAFRACFHAFYPSTPLKWFALCQQLQFLDPSDVVVGVPMENLLAAILEALAEPTVSYIGLGYDTSISINAAIYNSEPSTRFPILSEYMQLKTLEENEGGELLGFNAVATKLLAVVTAPIRSAFPSKEAQAAVSPVVSKAGKLLQSRISELALCIAYPETAALTGLPLGKVERKEKVCETSVRFSAKESGYPSLDVKDVAFSVNKPVVLHGLTVYGSTVASYKYEIALLKNEEALTTNEGTFSQADYYGEGLVNLHFKEPIRLEAEVVYTAHVELTGSVFDIGVEGGMAVSGPGGVTFTLHQTGFTESSPESGPVAKFLFTLSVVSSPHNVVQLSVHLATTLLEVTVGFLQRALGEELSSQTLELLGGSFLFSTLLPTTLAQLGPVACRQPKYAVEVLDLVKRTLPVISVATQCLGQSRKWEESGVYSDTKHLHYATVETDHPYTQTAVSHYKVKFSEKVQWMSLEFDPKTGFAQKEDKIGELLIPRRSIPPPPSGKNTTPPPPLVGVCFDDLHTDWERYALESPPGLVLLPGNEVHIVVNTDTEYVKKDANNHFGLKCQVVGYEWATEPSECLLFLEKELAALGGMCAASLLRGDTVLPFAEELSVSGSLGDTEKADMRIVQAAAQEVLSKHSQVLGRGLMVDMPTINHILNGEIPVVTDSSEQVFLKDFIESKAATAGGRLARWLQPDRAVDPDASELVLPSEAVQTGLPAEFTICTKDQDGKLVYVEGMKVEAKAVWLGRKVGTEGVSQRDKIVDSVLGVRRPTFKRPYNPTQLNGNSLYHSITMMLPYTDYSFEELRLFAPKVKRSMENMPLKANKDGSYHSTWVPSASGSYTIQVFIDSRPAGAERQLEVVDPDVPEEGEGEREEEGEEEEEEGEEVAETGEEEEVTIFKPKMKLFPGNIGIAGLRIRAEPSFLANAIGVIKPGEFFSYVDEIENDAGRWVKLSEDALKNFGCQASSGFALAYSSERKQEFLEEEEPPPEAIQRIKKAGPRKPGVKKRRGGPGTYQVVQCGTAGHNIRSKANMKGTPVGRLAKGNKIEALEEVENDDGIWLKLSKDSVKKYCETDVESWTLAVSPSGRMFLAIEGDDSYQSQIIDTTPQQVPPSAFPTAAQVFGTAQKSIFGTPVPPPPPPPPPPPFFQFGAKPLKLQFGSGEPAQEPGNVLFKFSSALMAKKEEEKAKVDEKTKESKELKESEKQEEAKSLEPPSDKPSFSIGSSGPARMSRTPRRARRKSSRSRSVSPSDESRKEEKPEEKEKESSLEAEHEPPQILPSPVQALSPAVAECQRAIFAAFLWQEGLVHDAMASASYLKFHPELTKEMRQDLSEKVRRKLKAAEEKRKKEEEKDEEKKEEKDEEKKEEKAEEKKEEKAEEKKEEKVEEKKVEKAEEKKEEKVEEKKVEKAEEKKEEKAEEKKVEKVEEKKVEKDEREDKKEGKEEGKAKEQESEKADAKEDEKVKPKAVPALTLSTDAESAPKALSLPPTLNHLVTFWDEISGKVIENASLPFPPPKVPVLAQTLQKRYEEEKKEIEKRKKEKDKKAAPPPGGGSTICELCDQSFPDPVTYHMKEAHPGCGKHASGWGYNSRGTFCSGWAGNCGDGGRGGSTWYLMCKDCHSKYLALKDEVKKKAVKAIPLPKMKTKKPGKARSLPVVTSVQGMIHNAKFLLEISCSTETQIMVKSPTVAAYNRQVSVPDGSGSLPLEAKKQVSFEMPVFEKASTQRPAFLRSVSVAVGAREKLPKRTQSDSGEEESPIPSVSRQRTLDQFSPQDIPDTGSLMVKPSINLARLMYNRSKQGPDSKETGYGKVLAFVLRYHDLDGLRASMKQSMRVAGIRAFSLEFLEWLLMKVEEPSIVHDVLWQFNCALSEHPVQQMATRVKAEREKGEKEQKNNKSSDLDDFLLGNHPLAGLDGAGQMLCLLRRQFHSFLQTIATIMPRVPMGSTVQQVAMQCWCLHFQPQDHSFLLQSNVFANISKALSGVEDNEGGAEKRTNARDRAVELHLMEDVLSKGRLKVSSNDAMSNSLTDSSTETFWESRDEPRGRPRQLSVSFEQERRLFAVSVHIDNQKDSGQRVESVALLVGRDEDSLREVDKAKLSMMHSGWKTLMVPEGERCAMVRVEVKGLQNNVRVRQLQVLGWPSKALDSTYPATVAQQKACEAQALRVFRLLTSQVFGGLLTQRPEEEVDSGEGEKEDEVREHMMDILFTKNKLSSLQKQVGVHIIRSVHTEMERMREEWEAVSSKPPPPKPSRQTSTEPGIPEGGKGSNTYCYELLSMLLGLSQSERGCAFLAEQEMLMRDLFTLLHVASVRIQFQVCSLLRRILPVVGPKNLAPMLGVRILPPLGYSAIAEAVNSAATINQLGIMDCLLAVIAKALSVQIKAKGRSTNILQTLTGDSSITALTLANLVALKPVPGETTVRVQRWYMKGVVLQEVAEEVVKLLKEMTRGTLGSQWQGIAKSAIGQAVLHLTKVNEEARVPIPGMYSQTLWLCLGALCVIDEEHAEALSSGQWLGQDGKPKAKPLCDNHDDGETQALILCDKCGNLCGECDRVLHYRRNTRDHQRQVFKEEEEAVKVELHEGCGRIKLYWTMALADYRTLKGMIEFRETGSGGGKGSCRFCGTTSNTGLLAIGNVCGDPECQERAGNVCDKTLSCGHPCCGVKGEEKCLPCLHGCAEEKATGPKLKQDADDMCMICYTEGLSCAPCVQLGCAHVFHYHCCRNALTKRWSGPRIAMRFMFCSICTNTPISHPALSDVLTPVTELFEDLKRKCLMRLEYENQMKCESITSPSSKFYQKPLEYAMWKYAYYVCFKCKKAYYGGEAYCAEQVAASDEYDPAELVCPACANVGGTVQICPKHGTDFLEYKCRYCCTVAVYFCFGTTHFCSPCHDDFQRLTSMAKSELPQCPVGSRAKPLEGTECPLHVKHPPTGEEFALGCGVCRNAQTF